METPQTKVRIPLYIRDEIRRRAKNMSKWIIEACQENLKRESFTKKQ